MIYYLVVLTLLSIVIAFFSTYTTTRNVSFPTQKFISLEQVMLRNIKEIFSRLEKQESLQNLCTPILISRLHERKYFFLSPVHIDSLEIVHKTAEEINCIVHGYDRKGIRHKDQCFFKLECGNWMLDDIK